MNLDIIPYASAIRPDLTAGKTVVVIDVLRASSVMVTALTNGARSFVPVQTVEEAKAVAARFPLEEVLLAGERDTRLIEGFHLGNSPLAYTKERVWGKTIILTTSNGTQALNSIKGAERVLIGAFLNMNALVSIIEKSKEIVLICAGTNNTFSMDDGMCAAMITDELMKKTAVTLTDFALTLHKAYQTEKENLRTLLTDCYHLNLLIKNGFKKDVEFCLQVNKYGVVPEMREGAIQ